MTASGENGHGHGHGVNSVPPRWAKRILVIFFSICGVLALLDLVALVWHLRYEEHPWEAMPVFYPVWGFAGIALLILISKGLRRLVMRSEDYYDAE